MMAGNDSRSTLHPRGKFARIRGQEVPVYGTARAGSFGIPVDSVSVPREYAPAGVTELPGGSPNRYDVIVVPRSEVSDLVIWDWFVLFRGEWYRVENERDGKFLIWMHDYDKAQKDPNWHGEQYNGWDRWISAAGAKLRAKKRDYGLQTS